MTWDLMHRYTSWFLQRDEERKPPQRIVSVKKNKISYEEIITYFVLQKVKLSKGQQKKKTYDNFATNVAIIPLKQHQSQIT